MTAEYVHSILCDPTTNEHPTGQLARALLAAWEDLAAARAEVERLRILGPVTEARVTAEARAVAAEVLTPIVDAWRAKVAATEAERDDLRARVVELEAPGECQSLHRLRALLRRWLECDEDGYASGQLCDDTRAALGLDRSDP